MMNYVPPVERMDYRKRALDIFEDAVSNRIDEMVREGRVLCDDCDRPVKAHVLAGKLYVTPCPCIKKGESGS